MNDNRKIRLIELFAGYGSQALALKYLDLDYESYFVCEIDKFAIQAYNEIHGTNYDVCDIRNITAKDLNICDMDKYKYLLTYSFPCQDLSLSGKQNGMKEGSGTRSSLLWEVKRILSECDNLPQYLLMENVPQVLSDKNINDFQKWCTFLGSLGYRNYYKCLNAKDYGIPQNRNRCFMVSILDSENKHFTFPKEIPLKIGVRDLLETDIDFTPYIIDKERLVKMQSSNWHTFDYGLRNAAKLNREDFMCCRTLKAHDSHAKYDRVCIELDDVQYKAVFEQSRRIYSVNGCMPSLTTCNGGSTKVKIYTNKTYRVLTPTEYFRLMSVKDEDSKKITVSESQKYKLAGNSIVVNVLMAIFENLFIKNCKSNRLF